MDSFYLRSLFSYSVGYPCLSTEQFTIPLHETGLLWHLHYSPLQEIPGSTYLSCKLTVQLSKWDATPRMCNVIFVNRGGKNNVITAH